MAPACLETLCSKAACPAAIAPPRPQNAVTSHALYNRRNIQPASSTPCAARLPTRRTKSAHAPQHGGVRARVATRALSVPTAEPGSVKIGFVGMGIMGVPMTLNLLKAGYDVVVWNRNPKKTEPVTAAGASAVGSARAVAESADIVFAMVSDPAAALAVATGPDGIVAGLSEGKGYVDVSTVDAVTSRAIAESVRATGAAFLEAPVSGSKGPAEAGALIFLTAGDRELFDAAAAPLDVMGKARLFLGEVGAGANMKLVINMIMGSMMSSFAEGLVLAESAGLSQDQVVEIAGLGAIAAPMFALKGPAMTRQEYPTAFPLKHQQKDLRLALELADELKVGLPVASSVNQQYVSAMEEGFGDADFSAVLAATLQLRSQQRSHWPSAAPDENEA